LNQHIVNVAFKSQKENQQIDAKIPQNFNHSVEYDLCVRGMNCFPYQAFGLTNSLDVWHHYASRDTEAPRTTYWGIEFLWQHQKK